MIPVTSLLEKKLATLQVPLAVQMPAGQRVGAPDARVTLKLNELSPVAKLDHICRKLMLREGERFLDIGAGWGGLLLWAAEHYGVVAHGITLSKNQHAYVSRLIDERGLKGRVTMELRDYRDLSETE